MAEAAASSKPKCFVIAPIGAEGSDTRWKSDRILKHIIRTTLQGTYDVERADDIHRPGIITVQIIQRLLEAPLVVADLSEANPNVYYELAIRHAAKKSVVHMIAEGEDAPFDVSQMRFIRFNIKDPDSIERAKHELDEHVKAIANGENIQTPVQVAQIIASPPAHGSQQETAVIMQAITAGLANLEQELRPIKEFVRGQQLARALTTEFSTANWFSGLEKALTEKSEHEKRVRAGLIKAIREAKGKKE